MSGTATTPHSAHSAVRVVAYGIAAWRSLPCPYGKLGDIDRSNVRHRGGRRHDRDGVCRWRHAQVVLAQQRVILMRSLFAARRRQYLRTNPPEQQPYLERLLEVGAWGAMEPKVR